jgi:CRISPR-associated protein Cas1
MKRTVSIATPGVRLYVRDSRLVILPAGGDPAKIPLEDVGLVVLEGPGIHLTSGALQRLSEQGAAVLACDSKHLPGSLLLPVVGNGLHTERIGQQARASLPLRKNLWARIVRAKIRNQAALLPEGVPAVVRLRRLASEVRSGDPANHEAQAARAYWPVVFQGIPRAEAPFRRGRGGPPPNSFLDYGYAVLRAATARALCGAGLHPGLGIHHHNRYSGFPLADDLMEPFRPWVDAAVRSALGQGCTDLAPDTKRVLLGLLAEPAPTPSGTTPFLLVLERAAATLAQAFAAADRKEAGAVEAAAILELPRYQEAA